MTPIPATRKALVLKPATKAIEVLDLPTPKPAKGEVLVRVHAIALNPVDSLYAGSPLAEQEQRVLGTDFAGVVVAASPELEGSDDARTKTGARVAGFLQGACSVNERPGAFAEYVAIPYDLLWRVPSSMGLDAAAAVSMCGVTAAQGVYFRQGLPCPFWKTEGLVAGPADGGDMSYFIYGASTSLGMYAAQLVRHAAETAGKKIRLIGAASRGKHAFLKDTFGYDVLVDYRDADWPEQVRKASGGGVNYAFDAISEADTVEQIHSTFADGPGKFAVFRNLPDGWKHKSGEEFRIKPVYGAAWEALGEDLAYDGGKWIRANPDARAFAAAFYDFLSTAADDGKVKVEPNPLRQMPGGLERVVPDGFALLGYDAVSGRKELKRDEEYMRPISGEKMVYTLVEE